MKTAKAVLHQTENCSLFSPILCLRASIETEINIFEVVYIVLNSLQSMSIFSQLESHLNKFCSKSKNEKNILSELS